MIDAISIVIHWIVCWQEELSQNAILNLVSDNVLGIVSFNIGKSFGHTSCYIGVGAGPVGTFLTGPLFFTKIIFLIHKTDNNNY